MTGAPHLESHQMQRRASFDKPLCPVVATAMGVLENVYVATPREGVASRLVRHTTGPPPGAALTPAHLLDSARPVRLHPRHQMTFS